MNGKDLMSIKIHFNFKHSPKYERLTKKSIAAKCSAIVKGVACFCRDLETDEVSALHAKPFMHAATKTITSGLPHLVQVEEMDQSVLFANINVELNCNVLAYPL